MNGYCSKIRNYVKLIEKCLNEMEELKKIQSSTFDTIARRRFVEGQDTILELTGKIQDLQNEINCMNDSKDYQDAESIRSGNSHVTGRPVSFPPYPIPEGNAKPFYRNAEPQRRAAKHLGHTWYIRKRFCKSRCVIFSTYPQELNPWSSGTEEPLPVWTVSQKFCHLHWRRLFKELWSRPTTTADFRSSFDKLPTPATFACWKKRLRYVLIHNFLRKLCIGSKEWRWLIQWMI